MTEGPRATPPAQTGVLPSRPTRCGRFRRGLLSRGARAPAASARPGNRCKYTPVSCADRCPMSEAITAKSTPRSIRCVAKLCRKVLAVTSAGKPARRAAALTTSHTSEESNRTLLASVRTSAPRPPLRSAK